MYTSLGVVPCSLLAYYDALLLKLKESQQLFPFLTYTKSILYIASFSTEELFYFSQQRKKPDRLHTQEEMT